MVSALRKRIEQFVPADPMHIKIPKLSLVVLIGPTGAGKTTFAQKHFALSEVVSSDECRWMICDDANDQTISNEAFELVHYIAEKRLRAGRLTVIDATSVQPASRATLVNLAKQQHCLPVAIVLNPPEKVCHERNRERADRQFGPHVIQNQRSQLRRTLKKLNREGFRYVYILNSVEEIDAVTIERVPLWNDRSHEHGPFDFIGDVHGCGDELEELLVALGYARQEMESDHPVPQFLYTHPAGRKAVFVGDLVDRGPRILESLYLVRNMIAVGSALCVPGNHDMKLMRYLKKKRAQVTHGLAESLKEIDALPEAARGQCIQEIVDFCDSLVSHYLLDDGNVVVAHAGMKEKYQGRGSGRVREFALYGDTTGETDEFGLPVRLNWAAEYRGRAMVVYGHTPVAQPEWLNNTINIDTGCVFGGRLTALRYPEKELVSVPARRTYIEPRKSFLTADNNGHGVSLQHQLDDTLDAADVMGKRIVSTRLIQNITIREDQATAALEVMSRYAVNPKWLIYLPPTMSPCETSPHPDYLEHPDQAFSYFRNEGVPQVLCEEKHMGSRAIAVVCRDRQAARQRFGVLEEESGIVYTRTGRRFFNDIRMEEEALERLRCALTVVDFWERFHTDWVCLDTELMPWSAKAQALLQQQYGSVGAAGKAALPDVVEALDLASERLSGDDLGIAVSHLNRFTQKVESHDKFVSAYRNYCWPVESIRDLKIAPFHIMATEGKVHTDQDHHWHMQELAALCRHEEILHATRTKTIDLTDAGNMVEGVDWWTKLTERGGEGMVVKPVDFIHRSKRGLTQPAMKVRGPEYLRIIYGPDYLAADNLERLKHRHLGSKRSLARREFALGIEALERFVRKEPLRRVHECVFGVLALESEPVDPRL